MRCAPELSPNKNVVFWGGWGGSTIVIDFDAQLAFSYVMNRMEPGALGDPRGLALGGAARAVRPRSCRRH